MISLCQLRELNPTDSAWVGNGTPTVTLTGCEELLCCVPFLNRKKDRGLFHMQRQKDEQGARDRSREGLLIHEDSVWQERPQWRTS